jgi:predicted CopG family antitoxin
MAPPGERGHQIKVSEDVYNDLTELGRKNETYSQIIRRLIDEHREREGRKAK